MIKLFGIASIEGKILTLGSSPSIDKLPAGNKIPVVNGKINININNCPIPQVEGEGVCAWVRIKKYSFKSKYEHNKGEVVRGYSLYLIKIEKSKW
jgi:hypothetical protein